MSPRIRDNLRLAARAAEAVVATSTVPLAASLHLRVTAPEAQRARLDRYLRVWARRMLHAGGGELVLAGRAPPPHRGPRLIVSNHRSMLDTPALLSLFGGQFLANSGLATVPLLGAAARVGRVLFVDRDAPSSRLTSMRAMKRLLDDGGSLIVFPEGTTFPGDAVQPFFPGAFRLAPEVEVLPVGLAYDAPAAEFGDETLGAHAARVAARPRTRVAVAIGEPLVVAGPRRGDRARALAEQAQAAVQALVHEARAVHGR